MSTLLDSGIDTVDSCNEDVQYDYRFKVLMAGNSGVGKTSFLRRYSDGKFEPAFNFTVGIDFGTKTLYR